MKEINSGVYPVMLTLYNKDGSVDYGAAEALTQWCYERGCHGIFATCLSSETFYLTLEERIGLVKAVRRATDRLVSADPNHRSMSIVASGHASDDPKEQVRELNGLYDAGADGVVLITNRMDIENKGDDAWISDAEKLISTLPDDASLGFYECPTPFKRPLTEKMLMWIKSLNRKGFIKDTCSNAELIAKRVKILEGSEVKLFNADTETNLETLRCGAAGFSGVMANFFPELKVRQYECYKEDPEKADFLQEYILRLARAMFCGAYPQNAKYLLNRQGIGECYSSRMNPDGVLTEFEKKSCYAAFSLNEHIKQIL